MTVLICAMFCGVASTGSGQSLELREVTPVHVESGRIGSPTTIVVDGEIVRMGDADLPISDRVVAGDGLYVLPGLWDLHTHLFLFERDNALPLLVSQGVTGVREAGSLVPRIAELQRRIERGEVLGPRIVHAGPTLNGAANAPHHRVIATPEDARTAVRELSSSVDFLKTHNATSRPAYFALLKAADEHGLSVIGHVPTGVSPLEACRAGHSSVEHIATLFEGTYRQGFDNELESFLSLPKWIETEAPELARCFAEEGVLFVPTLRTYQFRAHRAAAFDHPDPRTRYLGEGPDAWPGAFVPTAADRSQRIIELRESLVDIGRQFVRLLSAEGAAIGAGTDLAAGGLLPGFDLHAELRLLVEAGLTPAEALWASCRGPGEDAGGHPLQGKLAPGAPADLVLLRSNPLESLNALDEIEAVVLRGRYFGRAELDALLAQLEGK